MNRPLRPPRLLPLLLLWPLLACEAPTAWFDLAAERFTPAVPLPTRRNHALAGGTGAQVYFTRGTGADGGLEATILELELELRCFSLRKV